MLTTYTINTPMLKKSCTIAGKGEYLLLLLVALLSFAVSAQEAEVLPQSTESKQQLLSLPEGDFINIGKIMDREQRDFNFRLSNTQKRPLKLLRLRANCPCLSIAEPGIDRVLEPGESFEGKARINAAKLPLGEFHRLLLVEVENEELQLISLRGESVKMLDYEPTQTIELGSFAGVNVPWKRSFRIKSRFPEGRLQLHEPEANRFFDYKLSSLSADEFELEISAKPPLPIGRLRHIVDIPCSGVENYGPLQVALFGRVDGWKLALNKTTISLDTQMADEQGYLRGEVKLGLADENAPSPRAQRARFRRTQREELDESQPNVQLVSKEELSSDPQLAVEAWKNIAQELSIELPEGAELQKIPLDDGVSLQLSFSQKLLTDRPALTLMLRRKGKPLQRITVRSDKPKP